MNKTYVESYKSLEIGSRYRIATVFLSRRFCAALLSTLIIAPPLHAESIETPAIDFQRELAERDKLIEVLQKRLTQLGDGVSAITANENSVTAATSPAAADPPAVDAQAAERALERTLTQSGALLLPAGQAELQLNIGQIFSQQSTPLIDMQSGHPTIKQYNLRRTEITSSLSARIGLPFDAQLEFTVPYRKVAQSIVTTSDQTAPQETRTSASMIGDFSTGLAKTLLHERESAVDFVGRVTANFGNGSASKNTIPIGDGFKKIRTELTLLKRVDPLVFTGSLSFESTLKKNTIKPGNQFGVSLSALLATSPDTSLSIGIDQAFSQKTRVQNVAIAGSDQSSGVLLFGATSIVGKSTLLSLTVGKGMGRGAPDYFVNVGVPIRFDFLK